MRVALMIPAELLQLGQRLDRAFRNVTVEVEDFEGFLGKVGVFANVVGPQAAQRLIRLLLDDDPAQFGQATVHHWIAADYRDDARKFRKAAESRAKIGRRHLPEALLSFKQPGTIETTEVALVGDVDADNLHLIRAFHLRDGAMTQQLGLIFA